MKMSHDEYIKKQRRCAAEVACGMLDSSVHYLEGALKLYSVMFEVGLPDDDKDFRSFCLVSSEIDHLPIGAPRQH